ncbi:glycosyltransferase [Defluviimonas salinarum]|uniref:Glycosyltransferase n=1 Tax=Defluviimonas salinarum TaxID=2992147 RepID=A0ABT3J1Z5_9RHOB|nr:glycosyltransferase [Defluviimonas salinarum]MCW3781712.1 glycosyltransferase [Defluviimonas salinarum]
MTEPRPEISVVIPTHARRGQLLRTLEALERQSLEPSRFEVIVALDAAADGTAAALAERGWRFDLRQAESARRAAGAARNAGAAIARAGRLVFLDDDIIVGAGFLAAHLRVAGDDPAVVVVGQSAPAIAGDGLFAEALRRWWTDRFHALSAPDHRFAYSDVMSGNLSIDRAPFERLGGFDTTLDCREDYELGYRLVAAGARIRYAADAHGLHHDTSDLRRSFDRARAEGRADVAIARKHPELFPFLLAAEMTAPGVRAWLLRQSVFRLAGPARLAAAGLGALLPVFEAAGLRRTWHRGSRMVRTHAYHRSVAEALGGQRELDALAGRAAEAARAQVPPVLGIELSGGIEAVRRQFVESGPLAFELRLGGKPVARVGAQPGLVVPGLRQFDAALDARIRDWAPGVMAAERMPPLPDEPLEAQGDPAERDADAGTALAELDLADWRFTPRGGGAGYPLRVLVRRGARPLGWISLDEPPPAGALMVALRDGVVRDAAICERFLADAVTATAPGPDPVPLTVVVCTRDRTERLQRCLAAIAGLDHPDFEVIVVDNAPATEATARLVAALPSVRYVREDRPGLDWARNRGLAEARTDIVAFTDDDTEVDRHWLSGISAAFADPEVAAVTGLVLPMSLGTAAERYFENVYGGMGKGFDPVTWRRTDLSPRAMLWANRFGVGANMAFRRSALNGIGGFDPALDVGTATRGGGDLEMFHRVVRRGGALAYTPSAVVWHEHRSGMGALRDQMRDNGSGFAAYLLAVGRSRAVGRATLLAFAVRDWIWGWLLRRLIWPQGSCRRLTLAELSGLFRAPGRYRRARITARRQGATDDPAAPLAEGREA